MQTRVHLFIRVIGDMSEMTESVVGDFDNQAAVQQTVGALQTTVKLQLTFVNVFHSLTNSHLNYTQQYSYMELVLKYSLNN